MSILCFYVLLFRFQEIMEPPIPLKGVVLFIAFGSMVNGIAVILKSHFILYFVKSYHGIV